MSKENKAVKEVLFAKYGCRCEVCGRKFSKKYLTLHHIVMVSKGGPTTEENGLIACYDCHFGKINHMEYGSKEYWELMEKSLAHRKKESN